LMFLLAPITLSGYIK